MEAKVSALPSTEVMRVAAAEGTAALEKLARDDAAERVRSVRDNQRQQQSIDALREDFRESVSDANERLIQHIRRQRNQYCRRQCLGQRERREDSADPARRGVERHAQHRSVDWHSRRQKSLTGWQTTRGTLY